MCSRLLRCCNRDDSSSTHVMAQEAENTAQALSTLSALCVCVWVWIHHLSLCTALDQNALLPNSGYPTSRLTGPSGMDLIFRLKFKLNFKLWDGLTPDKWFTCHTYSGKSRICIKESESDSWHNLFKHLKYGFLSAHHVLHTDLGTQQVSDLGHLTL